MGDLKRPIVAIVMSGIGTLVCVVLAALPQFKEVRLGMCLIAALCFIVLIGGTIALIRILKPKPARYAEVDDDEVDNDELFLSVSSNDDDDHE